MTALAGVIALASSACSAASPSGPFQPRVLSWRSNVFTGPSPTKSPGRVEITEAEPAIAVGPLVLSAGPQSPFVSESSARCPKEMALVAGRVCVDRWEAGVVQTVGAEELPWSPFKSLDGKTARFRAVSKAGIVPQGYISGRQAELACRNAGKRLCTASEWEAGCRGPKHTQFPYGNERTAGVCNDDIRERHPVIEATSMLGIHGRKVWLDGMNLDIINQLPNTVAKAGERSACVTEEGLYDMVGNLHEWVADADGTFRGGYYMDTSQNGDGCSYRTTGHDFTYHDYSTGFRCCTDPEPVE